MDTRYNRTIFTMRVIRVAREYNRSIQIAEENLSSEFLIVNARTCFYYTILLL